MRRSAADGATFVASDGGCCRVGGSLEFGTVSKLLSLGSDAIRAGRASTIDLSGVTDSDSSGLALLIEWLSIARQSNHPLTYRDMPAQLQQLARLSEVDALLTPPNSPGG